MDRVEMLVDSMHIALMDYERVIILKEKTGDRYLPILVNSVTANAIAIYVHEQPLPNPPFDFTFSVLDTLGAKLMEVNVRDLDKGVFQAKAILNRGDETFGIPCSAGDAIVIALKARAPIFVIEEVISRAGIKVDEMKRIAGDKSIG